MRVRVRVRRRSRERVRVRVRVAARSPADTTILNTTYYLLLTRLLTPLPADIGAPLWPDERGRAREHLADHSGVGFVVGLGLVLGFGMGLGLGVEVWA